MPDQSTTSPAQPADTVFIPSARGGRKSAEPLMIEVVRELVADDIPRLLAASPAPGVGEVLQLRQTHHRLAQCIAEGHDMATVSLITGYSTSYISVLKDNPAFQELLHHYETLKEIEFVDVAKRMRELGLHTLEELQHRLASAPDDWSKRELMELAELLLVKGRPASAPVVSGGGSGVTINVGFVKPASPVEGGAQVVIDGEVKRG